MDVFISYSFQDTEIKDKLKNILQSGGIECYDAVHDEDYGNSLPDKLSKAIDNSNFLVAILTQHGSSSTSVSGEIAYAKRAGKRIIPMVENGVTVPIFLQGTEQIKFTTDTIDATCKRISKFITAHQQNKDDAESDESIEETVVISSGEYQVYPYEFEENDMLVGEITSDMPVNIYILNHRNFKLFENDEDSFTAEYFAGNVKKCKIKFPSPRAGAWRLIIQNEEDEYEEYPEAEVNVFLDVKGQTT